MNHQSIALIIAVSITIIFLILLVVNANPPEHPRTKSRTPGQVAYEGYLKNCKPPLLNDHPRWEDLQPDVKSMWENSASSVILFSDSDFD